MFDVGVEVVVGVVVVVAVVEVVVMVREPIFGLKAVYPHCIQPKLQNRSKVEVANWDGFC